MTAVNESQEKPIKKPEKKKDIVSREDVVVE